MDCSAAQDLRRDLEEAKKSVADADLDVFEIPMNYSAINSLSKSQFESSISNHIRDKILDENFQIDYPTVKDLFKPTTDDVLLTVENALQFEGANEVSMIILAGIPPERLLIALEPEIASVYVQWLETNKSESGGYSIAAQGTKYLVADIGGGTTDITVHEKLQSGIIKEINKASGKGCGGRSVDAAFFKIVVKIKIIIP
ncbi:Hypothetical predicted protein [Mytilus galloprovincialis]|uniref:Uncharacterized protein n=1 Tax=Mytilus galloprovincialis TaxID=29158 RepID=A0A8B6CKH1_MYTGA|nr:Hypothetical predicted protein [Mytilus galloprovincialis]